MTVLQLHKPKPCGDVVDGLRKLADQIETGDPDWPVTTCVVCLGHTGSETNPDERGFTYQAVRWRTHGYGPRTDNFTVRGLLATIGNRWDNEEED